MTLRIKLLLAQAPLAIAVVLLGVVSVGTLRSIGESSGHILMDNYQSVLAAQRMKEAIERIDSAAAFILAGREDLARPQADQNRKLFEEALSAQERNITEPGESAATAQLRKLWNQYRAAFDTFQQLPPGDAQRTNYFTLLQPLFLKVKDADDVILAINQDAMVRKSEASHRNVSQLTTLLMLAAVGTFLLGVFGTSSLTSRLLRPLFALSDAVRRLGEGDVEARALVLGKDEIADLAREFNTMAARLAQYRRSSLGELLQAQQSSQAAIDSLPDPVVIFGGIGELLSANRAAGELFGILLEVNVGDPLQKAPPQIREAIEHVRAYVLGGRGAYTPRGFEDAVRVTSAQGERCYLPRGSPVYAEEGGISGAAVVLQDVTRLLFFDQFKTDVVATVAHEFRTPLTSLRMAIHLCLEGAAGALTEKQQDLLQAGREDCERLQDIVDDLLDASRIQAGRLELHRSPLKAAEILQTARDMQADAATKHIHMSIVDETSVDDQLFADPDRLKLVLSNLVQNAIRYTPEGGTVSVSARALDKEIRIEVSDTGAGVPEEYHQRIFEKYFQVPGLPSGGAGLGLYISREVVLAHGGEMGVESRPGDGSTFWFTVPRGDSSPAQ
jgi:signal transduction histidine kinase